MMQPTKNVQLLCSVCEIKYKKEIEQLRKYKIIDKHVVCEECYHELFRLSKAKRKSLSDIYCKYRCVVRKLRLYETKEIDFNFIMYENEKIVSNFKNVIKKLERK